MKFKENKTEDNLYLKGKMEGYSPDLFRKLARIDTSGKSVIYAGIYWPNFNYKEALKILIQNQIPGQVYYAGLYWPKFDFEKALKFLNKYPEYYKRALIYWKIPLSVKKIKKIEKELNKTKSIKPKKFKLKEEILELIK